MLRRTFQVVADADFAHMLGFNGGGGNGGGRASQADADFDLFNRVDELHGLPESAQLRPHREAMGLPPEDE